MTANAVMNHQDSITHWRKWGGNKQEDDEGHIILCVILTKMAGIKQS